MKKVIALSLSILFLLLCSCQNSEKKFEDVKQEFSQYTPSNDVALVLDDEVLYFHDHTLRLKDVLQREDAKFERVNLLNDKIYYVFKEKTAWKTYVLSIGRCDLDGSNNTILFEKENVDSDIRVFFNGGTATVLYFENEVRMALSYDVLTNTHSVSEAAEDDAQYQVRSKYKVEEKKGTFYVTDSATQDQAVIDEAFLQNTPYYDSLKKYDYSAYRASLGDGKILLVYRLNLERFDLFPKGYAMVIFEYRFDAKELVFMSALYPYDCEGYYLCYHTRIEELE